jgi:hypothetical protein
MASTFGLHMLFYLQAIKALWYHLDVFAFSQGLYTHYTFPFLCEGFMDLTSFILEKFTFFEVQLVFHEGIQTV